MHTHIRHLRTRYRLPTADISRPGERELGEALSTAVGATLTARGLSPQTEVMVRRAKVRVRVRGEADPAAIAAGWARAMADSLDAHIARLPPGAWDEQAAVFTDRGEAAWIWLEDIVLQRPSPWWAQALGAGENTARVLAAEVAERPERVLAGLSGLVRRSPVETARMLDGVDCAHLLHQLALAHHGALERLGAPEVQTGSHPQTVLDEPTANRVSSTTLPWRRALGSAKTGGARALIEMAARAAGLQDSALSAWSEREPFVSPHRGDAQSRARPRADIAPGPPTPDPIGPVQPMQVEPTAASLAENQIDAAAPDSSQILNLMQSIEAPDAKLDRTRSATAESTRESAGKDSPRDAQRLAPPSAAAQAFSTGFGGLLFLIRWLARQPRWPRTSAAHLALARVLLHDLTQTMPAGLRRKALIAENPLVMVFSGFEALEPDEWMDAPDPTSRAQLSPILNALNEAIGDAITPVSGGPAWTLRGAPLAPGMARLAALLLRPGQLSYTRTHARMMLPMRYVDLATRQGAWDLNPGWIPWLGRVIQIDYVGSS